MRVLSKYIFEIITLLLIVLKLSEPLEIWNGHFPTFLKSTELVFDGWFLVFLPMFIKYLLWILFFIIGILSYVFDSNNEG